MLDMFERHIEFKTPEGYIHSFLLKTPCMGYALWKYDPKNLFTIFMVNQNGDEIRLYDNCSFYICCFTLEAATKTCQLLNDTMEEFDLPVN